MLQALENYLAGPLNRLERCVLRHGSVWFFLILLSYYILRPIREQVGATYGTKTLSWLFSGTFVAMLIAVPLYSVLVGRFNRRWLVPLVYAIFVSSLLGFWVAFQQLPRLAQPSVAGAFFIWVSVYGLFVVSFFWSVAGDLLSSDQGRRVFGLIMGCGTLGGMVGSQIATWLVGRLGIAHLLLVPAVALVLAYRVYHRLERSVNKIGIQKREAEGKATGGNPFAGFIAVFRSRYLLGILGFVVLMAVCSTGIYFQQSEIVGRAFSNPTLSEEEIAIRTQQLLDNPSLTISDANVAQDRAIEELQSEKKGQETTAYFAQVDFAVSLATITFQWLLAGFLMKRLGIGWTLALLPIAYLVAVIALAFSPTLAVMAVVAVIGRSAEYGLSNPAREVLFPVIPREDRYKAKSFLDTVVRRAGDTTAGATYRWLRETVGLSVPTIAWTMIPLAILWAAVSVFLGYENRRLAGKTRIDEPSDV